MKPGTKYLMIVLLILATTISVGQRPYSIKSPDGQINFSIQVTSKAPVYSISYKGKPVILNSALGLSFQDAGEFRSNLSTGKVVFRKGQEKYELHSGRARFVD